MPDGSLDPRFIDYVATLVRHEKERNKQIEDEIAAAGWVGWPVFLTMVFFEAVDRKLGPEPADAAIVRFVADVRAEFPEMDIDATVAERMIRSVFDPRIAWATDPAMRARLQLSASYVALRGGGYSDEELTRLLEEAWRAAAQARAEEEGAQDAGSTADS